MNNQETLPIDQLDQGITEISVQGFKSLSEESRIEIRPLTILAGANSSGKSSIMQPLLLMKQTLEAVYDPGGLLLNGANARFTQSDQILSLQNNSDQFSLQINFANDGIDNNLSPVVGIKNLFKKNEFGLTVTKTDCLHKINQVIQKISYTQKSDLQNIFQQIQDYYESRYYESRSEVDVQFLKEVKENFKYSIAKLHEFLFLKCESQMQALALSNVILYNNSKGIDYLSNLILKIIHLPGLRNKPQRSYPRSGIEKFPGVFDDYFASIIYHWFIDKDQRVKKLSQYLHNLGLTSVLQASRSNDIEIELQVGFSANDPDVLINIADVGFGVSQVLPVLVALLVTEPGQLVYLEQPELHLHPRAQANLAQPLIDAANRGVKVVVETHSDLLLTRIQTLVAEEAIDPAKLILHWFSRGDDGITKITSAELDQAGAYGDFPIDFNDVAFKEDLRYVEAAESQLIKK
jgi:predicted ATPase